jgi:type II secretory pathway pseudopilin PulG
MRLRPAFTLLELMISVAIVIGLTTAAVNSTVASTKKKQIDAAAVRVEAMVLSARDNAISGKKIACSASNLGGWGVNITTTNVQLIEYCLDPLTGNYVANSPYTTYTPHTSVEFIPPTGSNPVIFKPLGQGVVSLTSTPDTFQIIIKGAYSSIGRAIDISKVGQIVTGGMSDTVIVPVATSTPAAITTNTPVPAATLTTTPTRTPTPTPTTAPTGLIAWWKLDEGVDNTCTGGVNDACNSGTVGAALDGLKLGTWVTAGAASNAISFNGSSDSVRITDNAALDLTGDFTLTAWVRRNGGAGAQVISKTDAASDGGYGMLIGNGGEVYCRTNSGTANTDSYTPSGLIVVGGGWHHLAAVKSGTSCRVFVDGTYRTQSQGVHTTVTANAKNLYIGAKPNLTGEYWNGYLDEVRIYNRALADAEVLSLFSSVVPPAVSTPTSTPSPTPTATPVPANLLANPGFETSSTSISPWAATQTNGSVGLSTTTFHSGLLAAQATVSIVDLASAQFVQLRQQPLTLPNSTYTLTFWAKANAARTISLGIQNTVGNATCWSNSSTSLTTTWSLYTFSSISLNRTNCPTTASDRLYFNFAANAQTVFIDDVSLY